MLFGNKNKAPINNLHRVYGVFEGFILTHYGSLIGGVELYGRDPDSLVAGDFMGLSLIARNIYEKLSKKIIITQLYIHHDGFEIVPKERTDPIAQLTVQQRAHFLNQKGLSESRLLHFFEFMPDENLNQLNFSSLLKHLASGVFDVKSRLILKNHFLHQKAIIVQYDALLKQANDLKNALEEIALQWNSVVEARVITLQELWACSRFLANANSKLLKDAMHEPVPDTDWDKCLSEGDVDPIYLNHIDMLKLQAAKPHYLRLASVTNYGQKVLPGVWAFDEQAPMWMKGSFAILTRYKPLTAFQKMWMFRQKANELERTSMNWLSMITGNKNSNATENKMAMKPAIAQKYQELMEAENNEDSYGLFHALIMLYDAHPEPLIESARWMSHAATQSGLHLVWETDFLPAAFQMMQLAGGKQSLRDTLFTSTQLGAASFITKRVTGHNQEPDIPNEEAQLVLECVDQTPFYFNPTAGEKSLIIGIGPTGTGKTFFKNVLSTHFLKFGGILRSIDIDDGSETIAQLYGEQGGIFKITEQDIKGFNSFAGTQGKNDLKFMAHYYSMLKGMMHLNDDPKLRELSEREQSDLDNAIRRVLQLPQHLQRLGTVVRHLPEELAIKFERWIYAASAQEHDGLYAHFFDAPVDSLGALDKKVAVFNLQGLKEMPELYALVVKEITYRIVRVFENPAFLAVPKQLDMDEAHHFLSDPKHAEFAIKAGRTWRKYLARLSLWSQSPQDFMRLESWEALRSAAGTFIFMANPGLEETLYADAFKLTRGECAAIKNLVPKKEAYLIQPYLGVSKKVRLDVDPLQYVQATSRPKERILRSRMIAQYGFEAGIARTAEQLMQKKIAEIDTRFYEQSQLREQYYRGSA